MKMERILVGIMVLAMFLGLPAHIRAEESDSVTVKVTVLATLSVDITEAELIIGDVNIGTTTASATGVMVTNTGSGIPETYSLSLTDPAGWTASQTAPGGEVYVLNAVFDLDGTITWDAANHALSTTPVSCTETKFADDQTGVNVPHGETRALWFQFLAPTLTTVTEEQGIVITITAQAV